MIGVAEPCGDIDGDPMIARADQRMGIRRYAGPYPVRAIEGHQPHVHDLRPPDCAGLELPPAVKAPPGVALPFRFVRVLGNRALVSGHSPQAADGSIAGPFGKLGRELTVQQGYTAARLTALSVLGSLSRALGDMDRVTNWVRVFGMVNSAPGFVSQPAVINGFSDLILQLWGDEAGAHARSAVGMAELPFGIPVEVEAEVAISD